MLNLLVMATTTARAIAPHPYLERYGLRDDPFSPTASPRFAYPNPSHIAAANDMSDVVMRRAALGACFGQVGIGKTTLARTLEADLQARGIPTIYIPFSNVRQRNTPGTILRSVLDNFDIPKAANNDSLQNYTRLANFARENHDAGSTTTVIMDETDKLGKSGMEGILQLLSIQTQESQLVQVLLFGQNPELLKLIRGNPALHTRASAMVELQPFTQDEIEAMIAFRLRVAGRREPLFSPQAVGELATRSGGVPRNICRIAQLACTYADRDEAKIVDEAYVQHAADTLKHNVDE
jgi:type II secretory pathway predicted ATPase ExeA